MYINFATHSAADKASSGSQKSRGLSTIELLAALTLVSLLAGVAAPAYQDAVERRELSIGAHHISLFLNSVKARAVQRNRSAQVSYVVQDDGNWCLGATFDRAPCDCMESDPTNPQFCRLDHSNEVLRGTDVQPRNLLRSAAGDGHFAFDAVRGLVIDPHDSMVLGLQSEHEAYHLQLRLLATGKVSICQAPDSKDIRQYKPCSLTSERED